jgi:hypothetical protein
MDYKNNTKLAVGKSKVSVLDAKEVSSPLGRGDLSLLSSLSRLQQINFEITKTEIVGDHVVSTH